MVGYIPQRGDFVWIEFDPQRGIEIKKRRPAFVISPKAYNQKRGLMLCMPVTSQIKGYPFEVIVETPNIQGAILSDQIQSLDWSLRKVEFIEQSSFDIYFQAIEKITLLLR